MVRYIRSDELYHSGRKGMHWGIRLYQYEDGTYTPLGRLHYGIGINKKNMTGAEKIKEYATAARDTLATQGYIKYKKTETQSKASTLSKLQYARQQKADEKRAAEAMKKRQEIKEQARAAKEKLKADVAARKKAQEEAFKKKQEENIKANQERKQKYEDNQKRLQEELAKEKEEIKEKEVQKQSEKNVDQAKTERFDNFTNEDLKKFTDRTRLEAEALRAQTEARLAKMDVPKKIIDEIVGYGRSGLNAFNAYRDITNAIDSFKKSKVPVQDTPIQSAAKDILKRFDDIYKTGITTDDPDMATKLKEELFREQQMLEAATKIFAMTKPYVDKQDNNKNKNNNGGN